MTTVGPPICTYCKHYRGNVTCTAFPKRIPQVILESDHDHRKPYRGDHSIRFSPVDGDSAKIVAAMFEDEG